jgi:hypothetical protein
MFMFADKEQDTDVLMEILRWTNGGNLVVNAVLWDTPRVVR